MPTLTHQKPLNSYDSRRRKKRRRSSSPAARFFRKLRLILLLILAAAVAVIYITNLCVIRSTRAQIVTLPNAPMDINHADDILVLGCGVRDSSTPTPMLKDRLDTAASLWTYQISSNLILSGHPQDPKGDEVAVMNEYLSSRYSIPQTSLIPDDKGLSTRDSVRRIDEVYHGERIVIVSQRYHLYRALYLANRQGLVAYGVPAKNIRYHGQLLRDAREVFARTKDCFLAFAPL